MGEIAASNCEHARQRGCVYCPTCGVRYAPRPKRQRDFLSWLFAPIEFVARIYTPVMATAELDVTANHQEIRSGDPERIRQSLGFLLELAPQAQRIRPVIEGLIDHEDLDIALRARDVIAAMGPKKGN